MKLITNKTLTYANSYTYATSYARWYSVCEFEKWTKRNFTISVITISVYLSFLGTSTIRLHCSIVCKYENPGPYFYGHQYSRQLVSEVDREFVCTHIRNGTWRYVSKLKHILKIFKVCRSSFIDQKKRIVPKKHTDRTHKLYNMHNTDWEFIRRETRTID